MFINATNYKFEINDDYYRTHKVKRLWYRGVECAFINQSSRSVFALDKYRVIKTEILLYNGENRNCSVHEQSLGEFMFYRSINTDDKKYFAHVFDYHRFSNENYMIDIIIQERIQTREFSYVSPEYSKLCSIAQNLKIKDGVQCGFSFQRCIPVIYDMGISEFTPSW